MSIKRHTVDLRRAAFIAAGLSPEDADKALGVVKATTKHQRKLPVKASVTSPEMIGFFAGRADEQIQTDAVKAVRVDGDCLKAAGLEGVMGGCATDKERAEAIAGHVVGRIAVIRGAVAATINELRRREAVRTGQDPLKVKYLKVNDAPPSVEGLSGRDDPGEPEEPRADAKEPNGDLANGQDEVDPVGAPSDSQAEKVIPDRATSNGSYSELRA